MIEAGHASAPSRAAERTVQRLTGLTFPESRRNILERGLDHGMRRSGSSNLAAYLTRLEADPAVLDDLVAEITVGETYFFRDPQQLQMIRDAILAPWLREEGGRRPMRIWSAGCASGEEPYSLAILLHELGLSGAAEIVGTDIARDALIRARRGSYGRWALRATPADAATRYFRFSAGRFTLVPEIQRAVEFRYLNLAMDAYPSFATGIWGVDLILCRNVLIYFDGETVRRVAARLFESLGSNGWLVTGASDPPLGDLVPCEVVLTKAGLAYRQPGRKKASDMSRPPVRNLPSPSVAPAAPEAPKAEAASPEPIVHLRDAEPPATLEDALRAYEAQDYAKAAAVAEGLTGVSGAGPTAWVVFVRALANVGDMEAAGRACAAGLDRHRTCAELAYVHGVLLAQAGMHGEAAAALRRALYLDREMPVAHLALAGALSRLGEREGARRALRNAARVLDRFPGDYVVPASDGARADRLAEATRAHLRLLDQDPG